MMVDLDYFTCTLGEAALHHARRTDQAQEGIDQESEDSFASLTAFVRYLARTYPSKPAVGCPRPAANREGVGERPFPAQNSQTYGLANGIATTNGHASLSKKQAWLLEVLTFEEVSTLSSKVATWIQQQLASDLPSTKPKAIGLLASSNLVFLVLWLGLVEAGFAVVLIAPQCSVEAIKHLLRSSQACALCYDDRHRATAQQALAELHDNSKREQHGTEVACETGSVQEILLPWTSLSHLKGAPAPIDTLKRPTPKADDVAFYFHSSGTTGLPKLIPQTQQSVASVLPRLQPLKGEKGTSLSTFTATPLYHGGIADLLRAWSAASPLFIFPEDAAPITADNVHSGLEAIDASEAEVSVKLKIGYFSCVPFVLELLANHAEARQRLRDMHMVGVGGAALPTHLGDELVSDGVRLVSRFGSAECGFLLSSRRPFDRDPDWQYLRLDPEVGSLQFDPSLGNTFELVIQDTWPLLSPSIRNRLPFHTQDLFVAHPSIENAWKYVGRADAQLTLVTGKKFDPTVLEIAVTALSQVQDAFVVGNGKPYPAMLAISTSKQEVDVALLELIWQNVEKVNASSAAHARIRKNLLKVLDHSHSTRLPKSSKGTIMRGPAEQAFAAEIYSLYSGHDGDEVTKLTTDSPEQITATLQEIVEAIHGKPIARDADFFEAGIDSTAAIQIQMQIKRRLPQHVAAKVPLNFVYQGGTIDGVANLLHSLSNSAAGDVGSAEKSIEDEMIAMTEAWSRKQAAQLEQVVQRLKVNSLNGSLESEARREKHILLTGATGFMGMHILDQLRRRADAERIILPVRISQNTPESERAGRAEGRIFNALEVNGVQQRHGSSKPKIQAIPIVPGTPSFGAALLDVLEKPDELTHIIHAAWDVNFNLGLTSFGKQIEGVVELYNLAAAVSSLPQSRARDPVKVVFASSVASVARQTPSANGIVESISTSPRDASTLGYARSKWVAERVLALSNQRAASNNDYRCPQVAISRVGQLCGDTQTGAWNMREAWPLLMHAGLVAMPEPSLPDLRRADMDVLGWLPVDLAARAVIEASLDQASSSAPHAEVDVAHIVTTDRTTAWRDIYGYLGARERSVANRKHDSCIEANGKAQLLSAQDWLDQLEQLEPRHPAMNLLHLWRTQWSASPATTSAPARSATSHAETASKTIRAPDDLHLSQDRIGRMIEWIKKQRL